MYALLAVR